MASEKTERKWRKRFLQLFAKIISFARKGGGSKLEVVCVRGWPYVIDLKAVIFI